MNNIQNYGVANYQVNFQAKGRNKAVKTLADVIEKRQQNNKMLNDLLNKIYNYMSKLECHCNTTKNIQNRMNIQEGIIDIIR